jgi:hypothetical protein
MEMEELEATVMMAYRIHTCCEKQLFLYFRLPFDLSKNNQIENTELCNAVNFILTSYCILLQIKRSE